MFATATASQHRSFHAGSVRNAAGNVAAGFSGFVASSMQSPV